MNYRKNAISRPSPRQFKTYKTFVVLAVMGMLKQADSLMQTDGRAIRRVARYLRQENPPPIRVLYRGILVEPSDIPSDHVAKPYGVEFVSFTEDLQVACWFAAKTAIMADIVMLQKPNAEGWIGEYLPTEDEILFHHLWVDRLTSGPGPDIYQIAIDISQQRGSNDLLVQFRYHLIHQKEVICESHVKYPIKPESSYNCGPADELDNRFIPRGDFVIAPPGLSQLGIQPGSKLNIQRAIFHKSGRQCYQCQLPDVRATYILDVPLVVDICGNCMYIFRSPVGGQR